MLEICKERKDVYIMLLWLVTVSYRASIWGYIPAAVVIEVGWSDPEEYAAFELQINRHNIQARWFGRRLFSISF